MTIQGETAATRSAATRRRKTPSAPIIPSHNHDADWSTLMASVETTYRNTFAVGNRFLFTTDAANQFGTFLHHLPAEKLIHTCSACRRFVETYGGLVYIAADGTTYPALWDPKTVPAFYRPAVEAVAGYVSSAKVTGVFLSKDQTWGFPQTSTPYGPVWTHLSVQRPAAHVFRHLTLTPGQAMAAKREDFKNVVRALDEFSPALLKSALQVLNSDEINRAERFIKPVQWLLSLHWEGAGARSRGAARLLANKRWRAVAEAPDGFCHPRSGVIGSLLEDLAQKDPAFSFEDVRKRWNAKMHPLRYQRPQSAPTAGNIVQAEKLVEKMGIAASLNRRFARLEELDLVWAPHPPTRPVPQNGDGVFGHLKAKGTLMPCSALTIPRQTMTWEKFRRTALPTASKIEVLVPFIGSFMAVLTAADPDAPNILKWDNPFSVYVYHGGSKASQWRLAPSTWADVAGICLRPNLWGANPQPHLGTGTLMILKGAADTGTLQGNALFPEILRSELHGARSTIEAYSKSAVIGGLDEASACGIGFGGEGLKAPIRVTAGGATTEYLIDRWD